MTARHRHQPSPDQARYRLLLVGLVVVFLLSFLVIQVLGSGDSSEPGQAVAPTSTTTAPSSDTSTPSGSTTLPASGSTVVTGSPSDLPPLERVTLDLVFEGFRQPTNIGAPVGDDRLFVVQRVGVIRILDASRTMLDPAFLDITDRVLANGIEQGLLGLAFHPDYADNGRFFVYYTDKGGNRQLSEFSTRVSTPDQADPNSEKVIFEYEQPPNSVDIRHYGGNVMFGPDGYLWVSMGDGADSRAQGQDSSSPYGTIVRIDVDSGDPYSVPADNPFVGDGGLDDVWAFGLRNPWRFTIDSSERLVYIADVGHAVQEEINVVSIDDSGYNFGWSDMEGTRCFHLQDCDSSNYTAPVLTYVHESEDESVVTGWSVTGGHVYRGSEIPEIAGTYFYSDWVKQWIRGFEFVDGQVTNDRDWTDDLGGAVGSVNGFGVDGFGELYLVTHEGGVYRFTAVR